MPNTTNVLIFRCGSTRHTLSRCKKPEDPLNPLPFASCFVCSGKGHLASSCPQNKDKGVYPDGGCCKLCGETSHLAKNCDLRKKGTFLETHLRVREKLRISNTTRYEFVGPCHGDRRQDWRWWGRLPYHW